MPVNVTQDIAVIRTESATGELQVAQEVVMAFVVDAPYDMTQERTIFAINDTTQIKAQITTEVDP